MNSDVECYAVSCGNLIVYANVKQNLLLCLSHCLCSSSEIKLTLFYSRRNWTPQAVLYLKGARKANIYSKKKQKKKRRQSETVLFSREEGDTLQLGASHIYLFIHSSFSLCR
uniref:Uncharacterized protein n=1 Tax=Poecilia mexicana TaxID=48701 RepID=A0A3B3WRW9_9TELE